MVLRETEQLSSDCWVSVLIQPWGPEASFMGMDVLKLPDKLLTCHRLSAEPVAVEENAEVFSGLSGEVYSADWE